MKKPRKKPKPEVRARVDEDIFRALKLAVARGGDTTISEVVEAAIAYYPMVRHELQLEKA